MVPERGVRAPECGEEAPERAPEVDGMLSRSDIVCTRFVDDRLR